MTDQADTSRRPIFVGIGGDSGAGKTTITSAFFGLFGAERITSICLDDYHSLDRRQRGLVGLTALNPRANNFAVMEEQVWALKRGEAIQKPVYDHSNGTLSGPELLEPREVVIMQGLHPFLVTGVRHAFDFRVWLDPEPELRLQWKLQRDIAKRGYSKEQVLAEIEARRPDVEAYIEPQRQHADMVVRFFRGPTWTADMGNLSVRIIQRHRLPRLDFDHDLHAADSIRIALDVIDQDEQAADVIEIDGRITPAEAKLVEDNIWAHVHGKHGHVHHVPPQRLGTYELEARRRRHSDPLALTQLVLAHRILSAQKSFLLQVNEHEHEHLAGEHRHM
ncbi:MAG: phosphoribulokinase [Candidatus Dormibacteraceae bacterium]